MHNYVPKLRRPQLKITNPFHSLRRSRKSITNGHSIRIRRNCPRGNSRYKPPENTITLIKNDKRRLYHDSYLRSGNGQKDSQVSGQNYQRTAKFRPSQIPIFTPQIRGETVYSASGKSDANICQPLDSHISTALRAGR